MFVDTGLEVKADPFSLESLIAWLEKQPADGRYWFLSNRNCLLAQYFKSLGYFSVEVGGFSVGLDGKNHRLPTHFRRPANPPRFFQFSDTFGAALERARAALAAR